MTNRLLNGVRAFPCPECGGGTEVVDSRPTTWMDARAVRRRRKCMADASHRFTTFEVNETDLGSARMLGPVLRRAKLLAGQLVKLLDGDDPFANLELQPDHDHPQDQAGPR